MSGVDLVSYIRKHRPFQKMAMITAVPADIETAREELCCELSRPFGYEQLNSLLRGLAACTETHKAGIKCYEHAVCEFGLEHPCPFTFVA